MDYIYLDELYPNQNVINGFENLNYNKNIFYGSESLKDTITRMYQAIVKFIQRIWNWIKEQFRKLKSILNFNKKKIEETEEKIKEDKEILKNNKEFTESDLQDIAFNGIIGRILGYLESKVYPITINEYFKISSLYSKLFSNKLDDVISACIEKNIANNNESLYSYLSNKHIITFTNFSDKAKEILNGSIENIQKIPLIYVLLKDTEQTSFNPTEYIKEKFNIEDKNHYDNVEEMLTSLDKLLKFIKNINSEIDGEINNQNASNQSIQKIKLEDVNRIFEKNNVINNDTSFVQKIVTEINDFILIEQKLTRYFFVIIEIALDKIINDINYIVTEIPKIIAKQKNI